MPFFEQVAHNCGLLKIKPKWREFNLLKRIQREIDTDLIPEMDSHFSIDTICLLSISLKVAPFVAPFKKITPN